MWQHRTYHCCGCGCGVVWWWSGTVWVADTANHEVRYVSPKDGSIEAFRIKMWLNSVVEAEERALGSKKKGQALSKSVVDEKGQKHALATADQNIDLPAAVVADAKSGKIFFTAGRKALLCSVCFELCRT
jgi:hypothetical protein